MNLVILGQTFKKEILDRFEEIKEELNLTINNNINDISVDVIKVGNEVKLSIAFGVGNVKDTCWINYIVPLSAIEDIYLNKKETITEDDFIRLVGVNINYKTGNSIAEPVNVLLLLTLYAILQYAFEELANDEVKKEINLIKDVMLHDMFRVSGNEYNIEGIYKIIKDDVEEYIVAVKVNDNYIQYISLEEILANINDYEFIKGNKEEENE